MVVFITDDEQVIELRAPGVTNIGRASHNDVIPESKSVSKTHAQLTITYNAQKQKWDCTLEDLNSGNGTFLGSDILEMNKLNKKEVINFGDYVRFGHGNRVYKFAESAMTLNGAAPPAITAPPTYQTMPMSARGGTQQPVPPLNNVTAALTTGRGTYYPGGKGADSARSNRSDGQPKNMTISINYPTGGNVQQQAVSVVIDPNKVDKNRNNHSSNSGNRKSDDSVQSGRHSDRSRQHWQGEYSPVQGRGGYSRGGQGLVPPMDSYDPYNAPGQGYGQGYSHHYREGYRQGIAAASPNRGRSNAGGGYGGGGGGFGGGYEEEVVYGDVVDPYPSQDEELLVIPQDGGGDYYDRGRNPNQPQRLPPSFPAWPASSGGGGGGTSPTYNSPPRRALQPSHSPTRRPPLSSSLQAGGGGFPGEAYSSSSRHRISNSTKTNQQIPPPRTDMKAIATTLAAIKEAKTPTASLIPGISGSIVKESLRNSKQMPTRKIDLDAEGIGLDNERKDNKAIDTMVKNIVGRKTFTRLGETKTSAPGGPVGLGASLIPEYVISEVITEELVGGEVTSIGQINAVMTELNSLLKQAVIGSRLRGGDDITGADDKLLDEELQKVMADIVAGAVNSVEMIEDTPLVQSIIEAGNKAAHDGQGFANNVGELLDTSVKRLNGLLGFQRSQLARDPLSADGGGVNPNALTSSQSHAVAAQVLSAVLDDLDNVATKVWEVGEEANAQLAAHVDPLHAMKNGLGPTALSTELDEYRKLKGASPEGKEEGVMSEEKKKEKLTKKMLNICRKVDDHCTKMLRRAIDKWCKHAKLNGPRMMGKIDHETAKLRNEISNLSAKVSEVVDRDEAVASLLAERALNRELTAINSELRANISELGTKLHEVGNCPITRRQDMIKDLFLDREERLAQYRREAKTLEEQFKRLEEAVGPDVLDEILGPEGRVLDHNGQGQGLGPGFGRGMEEEKGDVVRSSSLLRNSSSSFPIRQSYNAPGPGLGPGLGQGPSTPKKSSKRLQRNHHHHHHHHHHPNHQHEELPPWYMPVSKRNAQKIIVFEVRRLRMALSDLQTTKKRLEQQAMGESARAAQLNIALQSLQKRLTERERSQIALRSLLLQRLGETGVNELVVALEQVGAGGDVLLREASQRPSNTATIPQR